MNKNKLLRFVQSMVIVPAMISPVMLPGVNSIDTTQSVFVQKQNIERAKQEKLELEKVQAEKAEAIDAYFESHDMPLKGTGMKMVLEAEKNELDWRLLPAIAVRESTGGKHLFAKNNPFGWGKKVAFESFDVAIETIARNLGGNNPKTEHHYSGKTIEQMLKTYNPPSVAPNYAKQVMSIMNTIGEADKEDTTLAVANT